MVYYTMTKTQEKTSCTDNQQKSRNYYKIHSVKTGMREGSTWALSLYFNPNGT